MIFAAASNNVFLCLQSVPFLFRLLLPTACISYVPGAPSVFVTFMQARTRGTPAVYITAMTSSARVTSSVTSPIDSARPLSYRLPIVTGRLYPVVSEIFSVKNGHGRARDNKRHPAVCWEFQMGVTRSEHPSCRVKSILLQS